MTYSELDRQVRSVSSALRSKFAQTDNNKFIGIDMENSALFIVAFWAILMAGFCPLLLNPNSVPADKKANLAQASAVCRLTGKTGDDVFVGDLLDFPPAAEGDWGNRLGLFSAGTSGRPKLIIYDSHAIARQILISQSVIRKNKTITYNGKGEVRILSFLPFFHIYGLMTNFMWFTFFGRTLIFPASIGLEDLKYAIQRGGVTHFFGVPLVFNAIARKISETVRRQNRQKSFEKALNFSLWLQRLFPRFGRWLAKNRLFKEITAKIFGPKPVFLISGGSAVKKTTLRIINGLGYPLYNGYGLTEAGIVAVELSLNPYKRIDGSVGRPFSDIGYRIDPDGVLEIRGDCLHLGVLENGVFAPRQGEYFRTSDLFFQKSGRLFLRDRQDDLIVLDNGEKISPLSLEEKFELSHVKNLCVFAAKQDERTEVCLLLELGDISSVQQNIVLYDAFRTIGGAAIQNKIRRVFITRQPLPVSLGQKVRRPLVTEAFRNGGMPDLKEVFRQDYADRQVIMDENLRQITDDVRRIFAGVFNKDVSEIGAETHIVFDLNGSSLEYYDLVSKIAELFQMEIAISADSYQTTPLAFAEYVLKNI
jgi:long-subunit acyl-CoA synthetase (AMP-forming)/acyl carrier protein